MDGQVRYRKGSIYYPMTRIDGAAALGKDTDLTLVGIPAFWWTTGDVGRVEVWPQPEPGAGELVLVVPGDVARERAETQTSLRTVISEFRATATRRMAEQDRRRPILSLIKRMRARKVIRYADHLERVLGEIR